MAKKLICLVIILITLTSCIKAVPPVEENIETSLVSEKVLTEEEIPIDVIVTEEIKNVEPLPSYKLPEENNEEPVISEDPVILPSESPSEKPFVEPVEEPSVSHEPAPAPSETPLVESIAPTPSSEPEVEEPIESEPIPDVNESITEETPSQDKVIGEAIRTVSISEFERTGRDIITYSNVPNADRLSELEKLLDSYAPNVSLLVYALDGSSGLIYNGKYEYPSQCTVKISWGYYVCKRIDEGKYSANDIFTYKSSDYYKGSGSIQYMPYGTKLTLEEVLTYMINVSDNTAYNMIIKYVDKADFDAFIDERGYQSYKLSKGKLWSYNSIVTDYASIWAEIYEYLQTDTEGARILRKACTNSPYNYGTYTLVDEDYSHKSGYYWGTYGAYNDAGIVWADQPYVYAIFTRSDGTKYDINFVNKVMTIVHEMY